VLDVGVGGGRTTTALRSVANRYVGIDYSAEMITAARAKFPEADLRVMDATDLRAFDDAEFDVVTFSYNGLDYVHPATQRAAAISELARVTRPGGHVVLSSHNAIATIRPVGVHAAGVGATVRARGIQLYASLRLLAYSLPSKAFWSGEGYLRDSASRHRNFATTPEHIRAEFSPHGLLLAENLGSRAPRHLGRRIEPWYYYVFRRDA
jgi:SAM-dependent methyltransferase